LLPRLGAALEGGSIRADLVGVVSNHADLAEVARGYGLKFFHLPVTAETKAAAEARQLELLRELKAELVVLARYMQVLSAGFLDRADHSGD
jgi:formyltetrahydrofolate deformylase